MQVEEDAALDGAGAAGGDAAGHDQGNAGEEEDGLEQGLAEQQQQEEELLQALHDLMKKRMQRAFEPAEAWTSLQKRLADAGAVERI